MISFIGTKSAIWTHVHASLLRMFTPCVPHVHHAIRTSSPCVLHPYIHVCSTCSPTCPTCSSGEPHIFSPCAASIHPRVCHIFTPCAALVDPSAAPPPSPVPLQLGGRRRCPRVNARRARGPGGPGGPHLPLQLLLRVWPGHAHGAWGAVQALLKLHPRPGAAAAPAADGKRRGAHSGGDGWRSGELPCIPSF